LKIVIVNDFGQPNGGAAHVALTSARELAARGHAVTYFCAVGPRPDTLAELGVRVVCLDQPELLDDPRRLQAARRGIWNRAALGALRREVAAEPEPPLVHIHGWVKALSPSIFAGLRGVPTVVTLHDYFAACPNGGFYDYQRESECSLRALSLRCITTHCDKRSYTQKLWRVGRHLTQLRRAAFPAGVGHFIAISRTSLQRLQPYLPSAATLHHVANPIDVERGEPADPGAGAHAVCVGRIEPEKGPHLLAQAVRSLDLKARFVGAGSLAAEVAALPQCEVTGWVAPAQARAEIRGARVLVLPSVCPEPFGLVVREAAALGVAAIVPEDSAAAEFVQPDRNGLTFQRGDERSLRAAVARFQDAAFARELGRNAFDDYWRDPSPPEAHAAALERVYAVLQAASA